jgi:hypothetical protein
MEAVVASVAEVVSACVLLELVVESVLLEVLPEHPANSPTASKPEANVMAADFKFNFLITIFSSSIFVCLFL